MPVKTSYTEAELADFMHGRLRRVAASLGWTSPASYSEAVEDTLRAYGVADISSVADVPRLLALATVEAWRAAVTSITPRTDTTQDGRTVRRSQYYDHARAMLADAETKADGFTPGPDVEFGPSRAGASLTTVRHIDRYCG